MNCDKVYLATVLSLVTQHNDNCGECQ